MSDNCKWERLTTKRTLVTKKKTKSMKVLIETTIGSISKSKALLLPIYKTVKIGKFYVPQYGLASFGHFDYTGALKDTEYRIEVEPTYDIIIGEILDIDDIVVLGKLCEKAQNGSFYGIKSIISETPKCYRFMYELFQLDSGVISRTMHRQYENHTGVYCITDFSLSSDRKAVSIMTSDGLWGAINWKHDVIVPQGKYSWVDVFRDGLARVKVGKETNGQISADTRWGLIDIEGKEILPPIYSDLQIKDDKVYVELSNRTNVILLKDLEYATYESVKKREKVLLEIKKKEERARLLNKPDYDSTGHYDYNKAAREQIDDAYDGQADAHWNTD